jgi:hypothetical protein
MIPCFSDVLKSWHGTPFSSAVVKKGVGVDCFHLTCHVLDEMQGRDSSDIERVPVQAPLHSKKRVGEAARFFLSRYKVRCIFKPNGMPKVLRPGDVLALKYGAGPGHLMIAGDNPARLWHSYPKTGVCWTGIGWAMHREISRVYRIEGADEWTL